MKIVLIAALSCAGVAAAAVAQTPAQHAGAAQAPAGGQSAVAGREIFATNCAACHQPEGEGIEGAFPRLAGNAFVAGDPEGVVATLLNGRGGMPSFRDDLKDDQLAAVASFIRSSWGNAAAPIPAQAFAAQRNGTTEVIARPIPAH